MTRTPLYEKLASSGARLGEYAGAETALAFGSADAGVEREFEALRSACAVYDLGWRAKLAITGKDRVRWLNGMVTNNIRDLAAQHGTYNFILSPQGRIQADCYAYSRGDHFIVGTEQGQLSRVLEIFDRYIIMDDVEVTDISDKLTALAVQGPNARAVLEGAGLSSFDVEAMTLSDIEWRGLGLTITRMASNDFVTYELWFAPANAAAIWDALVAAGATPVGTDALDRFRVAAGVPKYGQDIRDRDLPQETGQSHALNFSKGCYIGQEIVERIRSRGNVHRVFTGFTLQGLPELGTANSEPFPKLTLDSKEVGEITSIARIDNRVLALGYIRREHSSPGTTLQAADATARVEQLPFAEAKQSKSHLVMNS
jgi:folate-binding protein YgfZ